MMDPRYPTNAYQGQNYPTNPQNPQYGVQMQYPSNYGYSGPQPYAGYPSQQPYPSQYGYGAGPQTPPVYPYGAAQQPNPPGYSYGGGQQNISIGNEGYDNANLVFTTKSIRLAFIRKVYAILSLQMLVTIGLMALMIFVEPVTKWVREHRYLYIVAIVITLVLMIVIGCFTKPRRKFPLNVILLAIFTLAESFMLGVISISKDTRYVIYAALITMAIVIAITIFALQTKIDFTYLTGGLIIVSVVFLAFGIFAMIMRSRLLNLIYCCIGVVLFSVFLLVDTQLMLGGNHSYSISPEDYIFAALNLYVDIVQIFLMILGIFSNSD